MTFWIVTADYRPPSDKSPRYAFCAEKSAAKANILRRFEACYPALKVIKIDQLTQDEMGAHPLARWISWL